MVEPSPAAVAPAQVAGLAWAAAPATVPKLAADSDAYLPMLAGVAAATPLTLVSRALRNCVALSIPVAPAGADAGAALVAEEDPPLALQPAIPATTTGTSTPPKARHHRPSVISPSDVDNYSYADNSKA
jgi:hypothetical protein